MVQALQTIVSRKLAPSTGAVVSVTEFLTDGQRNVLPGHATLKGDVRARIPEDRNGRRALYATDPPTMAALSTAQSVGLDAIGDCAQMSFSEDFAHFCAAVPGCFILLGNGVEGAHGQPLHASDYDFNDELLPIGANFWTQLVRDRLPIRKTENILQSALKLHWFHATDGNHGRALAWGCKRFGSPCRIYIHAEVSQGRADAMQDLGAEVIRIDGDYDASVILAKQEAEENGWYVVSDTSWPGYSEPPRDVMSGYGVMTQEICDELDQAPTHVFLQGGVGGLAAGVAAGLRQYWKETSPRVVIVEPELAACLYESSKTGNATNVAIAEETLMAGLSCGEPSGMAWEILAEEASDFITIPESLVAPTVRLLANPQYGDTPIEAGESAIAGLAAVIAARQNEELSQKLGLDEHSRVLLIGSEGITDAAIFKMIMEGRNAA
ncbi:Diaminopropionate ammonia-lyase [Nymphon striatum]|nr:Diaminopropionate ammonia-lyase [Nymphon striatum]